MIFPERVLGSPSAKRSSSGRASAPISWTRVLEASSIESASAFPRPGGVGFQSHKRHNCLALEFVGTPHHGRFGDLGMGDQCAFDFHRAQAVAADIQHVIDATEAPDVAVFVAACTVAGKVNPPGKSEKYCFLKRSASP